MKFLHIIPPSRRMMDTYIRMLRENYDENEHHFYFINECPESEKSLFDYGNVQQMTGNGKIEKMLHLKRALDDADIIFWHGFIYPGRFMLFLSANPQFLRKSVWIAWGIDIYNWKRPENSIRNIVINKLNYYCRCHVKAVIALIEPDKKYFHKNFSKKIPCYVIPYPISRESFEAMDEYRDWKARENGVTYVQVAHNAHTFNRHIEILEALLPYAEENIRLFLPMSYGKDWHTSSPEYGKAVQKYANEHFSGKVNILSRLMPQLKYTEFLWNMDIAIFNAERQNALGNILKLLYMGNKVYLTPDGPLYEFFKEKNFEIYNTKDVGNIPYEEFIKRSENTNAIKWIRETYHPQYVKFTWKKCLEDLCGHTLEFKKVEENTSKIELQKKNVPMQKYNYFEVKRYQQWGRININAIPDAVIIGAEIFGVKMLQWIYETNRRGIRWLVKGFLDENIRTLHGFADDFDVIGTWKQWHQSEEDKLIFAIEKPNKRREAVNFFIKYYRLDLVHGITDDMEEKCLPVGELLHSSAMVSNFSKRGQGCLIGPFTIVDINAELGDFVYINSAAYIGIGSRIGNYCNIGMNCYVGKNVIIDDEVVLADGTVIPDGMHVKK